MLSELTPAWATGAGVNSTRTAAGTTNGPLPTLMIAVGVTVGEPRIATVIVAMLRGVALQYVMDDAVDLVAARHEVEQLLLSRLATGT